MIANTHYGYVGKSKAPKFTYTGNYKVRDDGVVELLTSGTIVFLEPKVIDVFLVGGGGGGGDFISGDGSGIGYGGGGGGYTRTVRHIPVSARESFTVTVGAGGPARNNGNSSGMGSYTVPGGNGASGGSIARKQGGYGGSGGGGGVANSSSYGAGGSDGGNGEQGLPAGIPGGSGQKFTTREFGETTGKLYAGGGGGGRFMQAQQPVISMGGAGGGGTGGWYGAQVGLYQEATAGVENTGGGGGGGAVWKAVNTSTTGASGGSGIVCFRESVELPELAGTWVLNERLYAPKNAFEAKVNYTATFTNTGNSEWKSVTVSNILSFNKNADGTGGYTMYRFNSNEWSNIRAGTVKSITFPVGTTASDEFRAWLASNATKQ